MGNPVEIEFVADVHQVLGRPQTFHVVQLRPMVIEEMDVVVSLDEEDRKSAIVTSEVALGHGRRETISDLIVIDPEFIDRSQTPQIAKITETINKTLRQENRQCILVGPGRWGSRDPWLGIPVEWPQISSARAIVETDFSDLQVEPSLGSHFFHNMTCFGVAFFAVHEHRLQGWVNWDWLRRQTCIYEALDGGVRHLRIESPVQVLVDGSSGHGVIRES